MKYKLNVLERLTLMGVLPKQGSILDIRVVNDLKQKIGFTDKEQEHLEFKQEGNSFSWNDKKDPMKEVEIGRNTRKIIEKSLEELDENGKVTPEMISIFDKFLKED